LLEDGGKQLIRIVDNGCGMSPEDARICFDKHATSKISSIDELESITTFGFRGEALASVAAIARVTLMTKEANTHEGIKLEVANSAIINEQPIAIPTGTDITCADLFYNVPARKKFLKKRETEWRHIHQLFQAFCLDYPHIHFKLFSEGKLVHNCPPTEKPNDRLMQTLELDGSAQLISIATHRIDHNLHISGIISDHQMMRFDRNGIFFFVNNRWIKNYELARALLKGYQNVIPQGRYPLASISISIDPKLVDVNIHPRKEEVKFMHPQVVENLITMAVKEGLETQLSKQIKKEVKFANNDMTNFQPAFREEKNQNSFLNTFNTILRYSSHGSELRANGEKNAILKESFDFISSSVNSEFASPTEPWQSRERHIKSSSEERTRPAELTEPEGPDKCRRILSQFNKTYILIEQELGLLFIDQHAAHERILYEQFRTNFENIATVALMFPQLIDFARADLQRLEPYLDFLNQQGIHAETFSENQLKITAIPVHLKNASIEELLKEILVCVSENAHAGTQDLSKIVHERVHAQMACKAAVKAGDMLSHEQMSELIQNLYKTPNRFSCPHGRPTSWVLNLDEIEKKFKRDYRSY
jgi:DNA mismatch repair protein MutL